MTSTKNSFVQNANETTGSLLAAQYPQLARGRLFFTTHTPFLGVKGEQDSPKKTKNKKFYLFVAFFAFFSVKATFILHNNNGDIKTETTKNEKTKCEAGTPARNGKQ